jgi:hypothetical protein
MDMNDLQRRPARIQGDEALSMPPRGNKEGVRGGPCPAKQIQAKASKFACTCLLLFFQIETYQWVTAKEIKKSGHVSSSMQPNSAGRGAPLLNENGDALTSRHAKCA